MSNGDGMLKMPQTTQNNYEKHGPTCLFANLKLSMPLIGNKRVNKLMNQLHFFDQPRTLDQPSLVLLMVN